MKRLRGAAPEHGWRGKRERRPNEHKRQVKQ